jgi:uncharacterized protein (TIGR02145 family)
MKILFLICGILVSSIAFSQDVVIFVQAKHEDNPIGLDTICIENLSNGTSAKIYNLPAGAANYEINLSQGAEINAHYQIDENTNGFNLLTNIPGFCSFLIMSKPNSNVNFELYNIRGQKLYHENKVLQSGINSFEFFNSYPDMGILKITTADNSYSVKVIGNASYRTSVNSTESYVLNTCQTISDASSFVFAEGDTLRITAKKQAYHSNSLFVHPRYNLNYTENYTIYLSKPCAGNETVTDYDGNVYNTVQIGNQCWMKENLNVTHYSDGTPLVEAFLYSNNYYGEHVYYNYEDNESLSELTGKLYSWRVAVNWTNESTNEEIEGGQGICPTGWHVPTDMEWWELEMYVDSSLRSYEIMLALPNVSGARGTTCGTDLKSTSLWLDLENTNDKYGFSVLPGGAIVYLSYLRYEGYNFMTGFWTSTQTSTRKKNISRMFFYNSAQIIRDYSYIYAASVRCVKN